MKITFIKTQISGIFHNAPQVYIRLSDGGRKSEIVAGRTFRYRFRAEQNEEGPIINPNQKSNCNLAQRDLSKDNNKSHQYKTS